MTQTLIQFTEQQSNLSRVGGKIGPAVVRFMREHEGREFHLSDMTSAVREQSQVSPSSPDRILRDLRERGLVNYVVVNRAASLYRSLPTQS